MVCAARRPEGARHPVAARRLARRCLDRRRRRRGVERDFALGAAHRRVPSLLERTEPPGSQRPLCRRARGGPGGQRLDRVQRHRVASRGTETAVSTGSRLEICFRPWFGTSSSTPTGRLWIASLRGLVRVDDPAAASPVFRQYTTSDGLSSNETTAVVEDTSGRLYVATARGLDRLEPATGRIKHFSVSDGLPLARDQLGRARPPHRTPLVYSVHRSGPPDPAGRSASGRAAHSDHRGGRGQRTAAAAAARRTDRRLRSSCATIAIISASTLSRLASALGRICVISTGWKAPETTGARLRSSAPSISPTLRQGPTDSPCGPSTRRHPQCRTRDP